MLRRRFALALGLLFLCLAMTVMWLRSNGRDFWFQHSLADKTYAMKLRGGLVSIYRAYPGAGHRSAPTTIAEFKIYYPILLTAFASYLLFVYAYRRRRRGHCEVCGYDLRATPDRCPECGTATSGKPA